MVQAYGDVWWHLKKCVCVCVRVRVCVTYICTYVHVHVCSIYLFIYEARLPGNPHTVTMSKEAVLTV